MFILFYFRLLMYMKRRYTRRQKRNNRRTRRRKSEKKQNGGVNGWWFLLAPAAVSALALNKTGTQQQLRRFDRSDIIAIPCCRRFCGVAQGVSLGLWMWVTGKNFLRRWRWRIFGARATPLGSQDDAGLIDQELFSL